MKTISPDSLIDMGAQNSPLRVEMIYANGAHPLNQTFKTALYKPGARLWLYEDLAKVVLLAAQNAYERHQLTFVLADGLRPIEAQQGMAECELVKANPAWTRDGPNLLISKPGTGAHPRGMAVDIWLENARGEVLDMGTPLDYFSTNPNDNPAARGYENLHERAKSNRAILDSLMLEAADKLDYPLFLLPSEWWDFRAPAEVYEQYAPILDADLPEHMQMCP